MQISASVRLGIGDFIFYSLLVGKTATRSIMYVADSMAGWLAGILTLAVLSSYDEPTPALSVPIDYHRCTATSRHLSVRRTIL
ncbi:Presenilin family protein [Brugia pahangi]